MLRHSSIKRHFLTPLPLFVSMLVMLCFFRVFHISNLDHHHEDTKQPTS